MRFSRWKCLLRVVAFALAFAVCFFAVQSAFGFNQSFAYLNSKGFPKEKKGSLDGVYIGASNVHAFWQPLIGWAEYGIAVYSYSFDAMPAGAVRHLMEVARKRQPDALYMVNLNQFKYSEESGEVVTHLHRILDYMPVSVERARMVGGLARTYQLTISEQLELLFPIIPFHSRWNDLKSWALGGEINDYKSSRSKAIFLTGRKDLSGKYTVNDKRQPLEKSVTSELEELLDYADATGTRVLFIKAPQAMTANRQQYLNTLEDLVLERGYPCLDLHEQIERTGIDPCWDFYNESHTNIHGSLKFTRCLAEYLIENYGFTDKRGQRGWESWSEAEKRYYGILKGYLTPFEMDRGLRAALEAPALDKPEVEGQDITLAWSASEGAEGYQVYRKGGEGGNRWRLVGQTDAQTLSWRDSGLRPSNEYTYTVVGILENGDETRYGSFDQTGVTAKTADSGKGKKASGTDGPDESVETDDEESAGGDEE